MRARARTLGFLGGRGFDVTIRLPTTLWLVGRGAPVRQGSGHRGACKPGINCCGTLNNLQSDKLSSGILDLLLLMTKDEGLARPPRRLENSDKLS